MSWLPSPRARALELIVFCDGFEDSGAYPMMAVRARMVARELLRALDELEAERGARIALQERCELQQEILGRHVHQALEQAARPARRASSHGLDGLVRS